MMLIGELNVSLGCGDGKTSTENRHDCASCGKVVRHHRSFERAHLVFSGLCWKRWHLLGVSCWHLFRRRRARSLQARRAWLL